VVGDKIRLKINKKHLNKIIPNNNQIVILMGELRNLMGAILAQVQLLEVIQ
jgi:hypothetical protein